MSETIKIAEPKRKEVKSLFGLGKSKTKYEFVPDKFYKLDIKNDSYFMPNGIIKYLESKEQLLKINIALKSQNLDNPEKHFKYKPVKQLMISHLKNVDISGALFLQPEYYKNINIANWSVSWSPAIKVKLQNTQFENLHDLIDELLLVHDYKVPTLCKFLYTYADGAFTYKFLFEISVITTSFSNVITKNRISINFIDVTQTGGHSKKRKQSRRRLTKKNKF